MTWKQIFFLCIVIGIGLLGLGLYFQKKAEAIDRWPSTIGKVTASKVVQRTSQKSLRRNDESSQATLSYHPVVEYEYTVDDKKYSSDRLSLSVDQKSSPQRLEPILKKYAPGTAVTVFYNPDNPADAVLEKANWLHWIFYVFGTIWLAVWTLALLIYSTVQFFR
ncbi:MAG TPA: DUF3592 domain-containing protein [Spirochaetota bacterium]|nr:DUF3592 domain-containing protein [Spirochaetota bacterium]